MPTTTVWVPNAGQYTMTATPYTRQHATGNVGMPLSINFTVTGQASTVVEAAAVTGTANFNGWLYHDKNRNGHTDKWEPSLAGIQLLVTAVDHPERQAESFFSYDDGSFALKDLSPGRYIVTPILPDHLVALNAAAGAITLAAGESSELADFAIIEKAAITQIYLPLLSR